MDHLEPPVLQKARAWLAANRTALDLQYPVDLNTKYSQVDQAVINFKRSPVFKMYGTLSETMHFWEICVTKLFDRAEIEPPTRDLAVELDNAVCSYAQLLPALVYIAQYLRTTPQYIALEQLTHDEQELIQLVLRDDE